MTTANANPWWEGRDAIQRCAERLGIEFGEDAADQIVRILFEELGGMRINVPTILDLERIERDRRIRKLFNGANHEELALRFGLHQRHIRRIVNGGKG